MSKQRQWTRCLYCDASIVGDHAHDAQLHDPYCPHGHSLAKLARVAQVLRAADRIGAPVDEPEGARYIQLSDTLVTQLLAGIP